MNRSLSYLSNLCRAWGGELLIMTEPQFRALRFNSPRVNGLTHAPDGDHAIDWPRRKVIAVDAAVNTGAVIHEMGHVFLAQGAPALTEENDWLGWEIALARRAKCYRIWSKQNADYELGDVCDLQGVSWGWLTADERKRVIDDRIDWAMALGILSQDGEPLCTRLP